MRLIALKTMRYNGQKVEKGQVFDASEKDGQILTAVCKAQPTQDKKEHVDTVEPEDETIEKPKRGRKKQHN